MMPGLIANEPTEPLRERAVALLGEVGLSHRVEHPVAFPRKRRRGVCLSPFIQGKVMILSTFLSLCGRRGSHPAFTPRSISS
jgi:hypothetical protein